jgi:hypothetical protein
MNTESQNRCSLLLAAAFLALGAWSLLSPTFASAQICASTKGYNAVWGTCPQNQQLEVVGTPAFIDASAWCNGDCNGVDFCKVVNQAILANATAAGLVVDGRGVTYPAQG